MRDLNDIRRDINAADTQLRELFLRRMALALEVAENKARSGGKVFQPEREAEILLFLAQGQNAAVIAESEIIALNTARTHIARIHRKMDVHNQQELLKRLKEL